MARQGAPKATIQLKVFFFRSDIETKHLKKIMKRHPDWDIKKVAWSSGTISLVADKSRGLKGDDIVFNGPDDFRQKLKRLLEKHQIKIIQKEEYVIASL